jgi:hypothetical protein
MKRLVVLIATLAVAAGCNKAAPASADRAAQLPEPMSAPPAIAVGDAPKKLSVAPPPPPPGASGVSASVASQPPTGPIAVPADRKVLRNGSLTLEVRALDDALAAIRTATEKAGGYVTNESQGRDMYGARHGSVTCRVPAGSLDKALAQFQTLGKVESVNVTAEDITEQYFNLEIRLRNQQDLEKRFRALLDKPGNKVSDLLEIEREMARVRGEIDELEGRKRFWDSQVSLSTVTVNLHEPRPVVAGEGGGVLSTLAAAFLDLGENLVGTVAWLIAAIGVVIPALVALWIAWRLWRAVRGRRGSARKPPA